MLGDGLRLINYSLMLLSLFFIFGCSSKTSTKNTNYSKSNTTATMRPYTVAGKKYYPAYVKVGDTQIGIASWYGPTFHGKKTSNGEIYNMHSSTAAHKTFPMNTIVRVYNLENGKTTVVRINDRGPFVTGRIIDLSNKAAHDIAMVGKGTAKVKIEVIDFKGQSSYNSNHVKIASVSNFMVQIGAFRNILGANITAKEFNNFKTYKTKIKQFYLDGAPIYRVFLTGFGSENEARDFIKEQNFNGAFIVGE